MEDKNELFSKVQIRRLIIPLMIEQVLTSLMGTADTMMVSNVGSSAISAVSLVDSINVLVIFVFSAMATGGGILCAQYIGNQNMIKATEAAKQLVLTVTVISVGMSLICVFLRAVLLQLIFGKVEEAVMRNAEVYMLITGISYPFIGMYNAGAVLFRTQGNSRFPLLVSTAGNILNIAGNAVLIFVFHMGVTGAALATLASRIFCSVTIMVALRNPSGGIVIRDYRHIRPDFSLIRKILAIGIPSGIENGMFQFGKLVIQSTVSTMGTVAIAANAMTVTMETLNGTAPVGIGLALMTIVGQCMGAGKPDEARKNILRLCGYSYIAVTVSCAITALLVRPITILGGMESEAAVLTCRLTWLICIVKPLIWVTSFIPGYGLRGAGDVRFSMILSSLTMWFCRVLITVSLVRLFGMGPLAVWLGMFSDWFIRSIFFIIRFYSGKWTRHNLIQNG